MVVIIKHLSPSQPRDKQKAVANGSMELALFRQAQGDVGQFGLFWFCSFFENDLLFVVPSLQNIPLQKFSN